MRRAGLTVGRAPTIVDVDETTLEVLEADPMIVVGGADSADMATAVPGAVDPGDYKRGELDAMADSEGLDPDDYGTKAEIAEAISEARGG